MRLLAAEQRQACLHADLSDDLADGRPGLAGDARRASCTGRSGRSLRAGVAATAGRAAAGADEHRFVNHPDLPDRLNRSAARSAGTTGLPSGAGVAALTADPCGSGNPVPARFADPEEPFDCRDAPHGLAELPALGVEGETNQHREPDRCEHREVQQDPQRGP